MAGEVEGQVLLQLVDRSVVVGRASLVELLERGVRAGDVRGVVLVVVELEDLGRIVGFECGEVVGQFRQVYAGMGALLVGSGLQRGRGSRSFRPAG